MLSVNIIIIIIIITIIIIIMNLREWNVKLNNIIIINVV